ncbi:hypothetical protein CRUP_019258 [Coryphaenoides rupestris]|nr:hypothetical protein CRUP_019258 [Coryphaenoides rupestris]
MGPNVPSPVGDPDKRGFTVKKPDLFEVFTESGRDQTRVVATMRDLKKKEKLLAAAGDAHGRSLTLLPLDVCSDASVSRCISSLPERRVDVLINNAGVGLLGPLESISIQQMKDVFETNFFGAVRMIKEVLPDMKARRSGHILVMSSVMGLQGVVFNDVYTASKFAMEGFCESMAVQLLKFNVSGGHHEGPEEEGELLAAAGDAHGRSLTLLPLDVCSDASVSRCISSLPERREVLPDMKARRSGHILVMSSVMGLQGVVFNDVYTASKFAMEGFCESMAVQLLKFNVRLSMIEPGPVHTEFESKMLEDVSRMEFPGVDADTVRYFKDVYLPSSLDIFECTKKVIESSSPRFRNLTNSLYTPIVALKYADETGGLSINTFYNLLFNLGPLMHITMSILKCLTCSCLRRRTISPD